MKSKSDTNTSKLKDAMRSNRMVSFDYINTSGDKVRNVKARVIRISGDIAHFGVVNSANSTAHPGFRPINIGNLRSIRILKTQSSSSSSSRSKKVSSTSRKQTVTA